ncbi:MAG: 2-vinyl bacteriochlorophyllide hydratase [Burkholderiaceae bacterium]|jgi:3-vinyl bacteriochlorophyllide hydratase
MRRISRVSVRPPLYTAEERARRNRSPWTRIQGILAPLQFLIFLVSFGLVMRYLATGKQESLALASVVVKTVALYAIMVTGCLWEKDVFGRYLFAPAFFWEDAVSMLVIALHSLYLYAWWFTTLDSITLSELALAAYATYAINALQFVTKFRMARIQRAQAPSFGQLAP